MLVISAVTVVSLIGAIVPGECLPTAIVETTSGPVQGEILNTVPTWVPYAVFKGIRYAKAPVGDLRFKPPVPAEPWRTTLNALTYGNPCPHIDEHSNFLGSEDCLFLNIFTPQTSLSFKPIMLKPVMFWIHGGDFVGGSGSMDIMGPDYFLERSIVFVSINYRLGALGFLSLDHPSATGNAGLKDQNLALKWVKANIAKFGGDPNSITLIGQGSGSAMAGYHILSKSSTDLFHRAILMSGSPLSSWAFHNISRAVSTAERFGKHLGVNTADKEILLNALNQATPHKLVTSNVLFAPTVERASIAKDPFITESPYRTFYTGNYNKVPQIIGFMEQETVSFIPKYEQFLDRVNVALAEAEEMGIEGVESLTTVRDALTVCGTQGAVCSSVFDQIDSTILQSAINITSQLLFISPIDRNQQFIAESNGDNPVYYYYVSLYTDRSLHRLMEPNSKINGAGLADDVAFILYIPTHQYNSQRDPEITNAIQKVSNMWASFATYGNPTPTFSNIPCSDVTMNSPMGSWKCIGYPPMRGSLLKWPAASPCKHILDVGKEFVIKPRPINRNLELLQSLSWSDEKRALDVSGLLRPAP